MPVVLNFGLTSNSKYRFLTDITPAKTGRLHGKPDPAQHRDGQLKDRDRLRVLTAEFIEQRDQRRAGDAIPELRMTVLHPLNDIFHRH